VKDSQRKHSADKFEVVEVFGVDATMRVNLKGIIVDRRVLEKTIKWIEHLMGQQKEELSRDTAIIKSIFPIEFDHQAFFQVIGLLPHDLSIAVLEDMAPTDLNMALARIRPQGWLRPEVDQLPSEVTFVLGHVLVK